MDAGPSAHPTFETLQAYGFGKLDDASAEVVSKHLEDCPDCRRQVTEMAPDSFLGRLPDAEEKHETSVAGRAVPVGPPPGETVAEDAPVNSSSSPAMSSTGQAGATSEASSKHDETSLPSGTRVGYFGDYELLKVLGEGGMGIVYKARQLSLNRLVALKMIKASRFPSVDEVRRFHNEAEAVARLDHPNIVPVFEVGQYENQHYFSMKLIAGESLDKKSKDYLADPRRAAELLAITAGAIHHAHQRGILHRDLKPANILIDSEGRPHVTDFGLAKRVEGDSELTRSGAILGTPAYMAPEQASGKRGTVTTSTDVYGLGAVLYVLLTGKAPFSGDSVLDTLEQVRERLPEPPTSRNRRVPRDLEVICLKCLEKDPRLRYASADSLAEDLKRWLAGEPIAARPVGNTTRLWMWCRRRPMVAASLSAAVLVSCLAGLIGTSLGLLAALSAHAKERNQTKVAEQRLQESLEAQANERKLTELAEQRQYDVRMNLVQRYWEDYSRELFQHGLVEQLPANQRGIDRRGFEWFYWQRKITSGHITLEGHTKFVRSLAFSPDGKLLASAGDNWMVKVWDVVRGRETLALEGQTKGVIGVAFSGNGKWLVSVGLDGTVKMWDLVTGQEGITLKGHTGDVLSVAFSPDGKQLAFGCQDGMVAVWNIGNRQETRTFRHQFKGISEAVHSMAFDPDGKRLALAWNGFVTVCDIADGREELTLKWPTADVNFSPDGKHLAGTLYGLAAGPWDWGVKVWDASTGQETLNLLKVHGNVSSVAFSSYGRRLATCEYETVQVWDAVNGQEILTLKGHTSALTHLAFSPDGKLLASACLNGTVKVWDAVTGQDAPTLSGHTHRVSSVAFNPDGNRLASADHDGTIKVWDAFSGQQTLTLESRVGFVNRVAFNTDGKVLAIVGYDLESPGGVRLWNTVTGELRTTFKGHRGQVEAVAFSPKGNRLASAGRDGIVKVWDAMTGKEFLTLKWQKSRDWSTSSLAFSPEGRRLACASSAGLIQIWDVATGAESLTLEGHTDPYSTFASLAYSPDGKRLASGMDRTVQVWDAETGQESLTLRGHTAIVTSVAFSPDGKRLASASGDRTIKLWDTTTGQETLTLKGHTDLVSSVSFSPDGSRLASAGRDRSVRVWDARPLLSKPALSAVDRTPP